MLTRSYKCLRMTIHLLSIFQILLSIGLFIIKLIYMKYLNSVEPLLNISYLDLHMIYKIIIITNIILSLFSICCIYTQNRLYKKIYILTNFITLSMIVLFLLYCKYTYIDSLNQCVAILTTNVSKRTQIKYALFCDEYGENGIHTVLKKYASELIRYFLLIGLILFFINSLNLFFIKISNNIQTKEIELELPKIHRNERVGFETTSLRAKRVIESKIENPLNLETEEKSIMTFDSVIV